MGVQLRRRWRRLWAKLPTILQCALGAAVAWTLARHALDHPRPFFAPIAVVVCIGAGGNRLRRLAELVVGVSLGVGIGDLLILQIGSGAWQIALVIVLAMGTAVLLDTGQLIMTQAASSAILVATLLPPTGTGGLDRMVDALLGGLLGILAICVLPADPRTLARRSAAPVMDVLAGTFETVADAIEHRDADRATAALRIARGGQPAVEAFDKALDAGREIVLISPMRRGARPELTRFQAAADPLDHAVRNARVLARRSVAALRDHEPIPPAVGTGLREMARAVRSLQEGLRTGETHRADRGVITAAAAATAAMIEHPEFSTHVIAAQLRSIAVDLLRAGGMRGEDARAAIPRLHAAPRSRAAGEHRAARPDW